MTITKTVPADLIKARINELQSDIDRVKSDLQSLKGSVVGTANGEDIQKVDNLVKELIVLKGSQAELINLLN